MKYVENVFIRLCAMCAFSLGTCLFISFAHFLIGLFVYLLLIFKISLHMLDTFFSLKDMCFIKIFLPVCGLSFHSPNGVFLGAQVLNFNEVQLLTQEEHFFFTGCDFGGISTK